MTSITVGGVTFHNSGALDADGVSWLFEETKGWFDGPPVKGGKTDRPQGHGSFAERAFRDGRTITVTGSVHAPSRALASSAQMTLTALLAGGTFDAFTVDDEDQGVMSAQVQIEDQPLVDWYADLDIDFQLTFYAPDPLRYGAPVPVTTGFPVLADGLEFDLFTDGTTPLVRTNLVTNPSFEVDTTTWVASSGTIAADAAYAAVGTKSLRLDSTASNSQVYMPTALPASGSTTYTLSAYVRGTGSVTPGMLDSVWSPFLGSATALTSAWQRISTTWTSAPGETTMSPWFIQNAGGANSMWVDGVLLETSPAVGTYFDGSSPGGAWTGTPNASTSTRTDMVGTDTGFLEYGASSDTGRLVVANPGNADVWPLFEVTGPVPAEGLEIVRVGSGERLRFEGGVSVGSRLVLDSASGVVVVDGYADRSGLLTVRDWSPVSPQSSAEFEFVPLGASSAAILTATVSPGFW